MFTSEGQSKKYICKPNDEIPNDAMNPGDTLSTSNEKHTLIYTFNGEVIIMESEERRREIIFHHMGSKDKSKKLLFKHAEGVVSFQTEAGEEILLSYKPSAGTPIADRKFYFDKSGHIFAKDPKHSVDQIHKLNNDKYISKSSFLHTERLETSKKVMLRSDNGNYQLESTDDCSEVILRRVDGKEPVAMRFKGTGKYIKSLYFEGQDVWIENDTGSSNKIITDGFIYSIELSDNGALVARNFSNDLVWATKRNTLSSIDKTSVKFHDGRLVKQPGDTLPKGSKLESTNGSYAFEFRKDGNAVLYRTSDNHILYETATKFDGESCRLALRDGNLVIEDSSMEPAKLLWECKSTPKTNKPRTCLTLSDEGVLSIQTDFTESKQVQPVPEIFWQRPLFGVMNDGHTLRKGEWLTSPNHRYVLSLQENGNLIIHKYFGLAGKHLTHIPDSDVIFESLTHFDGPGSLTFTASTGKLILKKDNGEIVWQTDHRNQNVEHAQLRDDGRLQFLDSTGAAFHDFTLPKDYLLAEPSLKGRNKLVSPSLRYILTIGELLALDEKDEQEKIVIRDSHNDWDNVYEKTPKLNLPYVLTSKDGRLIYKEHGKEVKIKKIELTDVGLSVTTEVSCFSVHRNISFAHCWYGDYSLPPGLCMYSPNRKFGLFIQKDRFSIKNLRNGELMYSSHRSGHVEHDSSTFFVSDGFLKFGRPGSTQNAESILWRSDTQGFSRMELGNEGILKVYDNQAKLVWQSLRIACLAWGSLIWDPRNLPMVGGWRKNGPKLRVEFLRKSADGRITLVLSKNARAVSSEWTLMDASSLESAIHGLALREGITNTSESNLKKVIGVWPPKNDVMHENKLILDLEKWAKKHDISHIIWTNLGPKHPLTGKTAEAGSDEIIKYLLGLKEKAATSKNEIYTAILEKAEEYIRRAPPQINTYYRKVIEERLGWTQKSGLNEMPHEAD